VVVPGGVAEVPKLLLTCPRGIGGGRERDGDGSKEGMRKTRIPACNFAEKHSVHCDRGGEEDAALLDHLLSSLVQLS
jgi:hypothetical protein